MTRRMTDGLIILAMLALGASHLWAEAGGGRRIVRPNQVGGTSGSVVRGADGGSATTSSSTTRSASGTSGAFASGAIDEGNPRHEPSSGVTHTGTCAKAVRQVVACR